jgi:hypothetical protein
VTDTVDKIVIQSEVQGVQQSTDQLNQLGKSMDGVTVAASNVEKSTGTIDSKFASLERRFQTTAGQAAQFEKIQNTVNAAVGQNPELQGRANDVLAAAEARYLGTGKAVTELANAHKGLDSQGQAALHSIRSVAEQLALGIPPTQALAGQINHLTYAASGEGGLSGAFGQVASIAGRMITPLTVAIGTTAALAAGAAYLALQYDKVQVSSQRALLGAGERTGTTIGDLNNFASKNSSSSTLSSDAARKLGEDFTASGNIAIGQLQRVDIAVAGFATQTGKSVGDAVKDFERFGSDPVKALDELGGIFGTVNQHIRDLVELQSLGIDKTAAFNTVLDAYAEKLKKAGDNANFLEKASRFLSGDHSLFSPPKAADPQDQLEAVRKQLNAAIEQGANSTNPVDRGFAAKDVADLSRQFEELQKKREDAIGGTAKAQMDALDTEAGRAAEQVRAIAKSWGDVGVATALALNSLQQQATLAAAVTGQEQMAAQAAIDFANAKLKGKSDTEAEALASGKQAVSEAAATAAVEKQTAALKDQNALIRAHQTGTEATTAAAIAYKNAIETGADSTAAAALKTQTLANYMAQAGDSARTLDGYLQTMSASLDRFNSGLGRSVSLASAMRDATSSISGSQAASMAQAEQNSWQGNLISPFQPDTMPGGALSFVSAKIDPSTGLWDSGGAGPGSLGGLTSKFIAPKNIEILQEQLRTQGIPDAYAKGGADGALAAIRALGNTEGGEPGGDKPLTSIVGDKISLYDQFVQLKNSQTTDKASQATNIRDEIGFLQGLPGSVERDQKIADLTQSINGLITSTDSLTKSNQDLLSPYYTQDPRTSHIGFRSQGMASGGWVDVPGAPSSNDNMIAQIPVAGGERILVDPNRSVRGGGNSGGTVINISAPMTFNGPANRDEVGRTVFQNMQHVGRQIAATQ